MHKSATKCNKTIGKWYKNKHGASKIIDTLETYQGLPGRILGSRGTRRKKLFDALPLLIMARFFRMCRRR
jgi:hypothetical protein